MKAGAIALDILSRNPEHPGAVHYAIHAFDDPAHAPLGLHAAQIYSRIAPDAPHAQHMTTHIFLALGMWDDVIAQNTVASGPARDQWRPGHYTSWLGYGLLQAGRHDEAARHLDVMWRNLRPAPVPVGYMMLMRAAYLLDTERWGDPAGAWDMPATTWTAAMAADAFARAYAALRSGNAGTHEEWRERLARLAEGSADEVTAVLTLLLEAAEAHAAGADDRAIGLLREAAAREEKLPVEFGPPVIVKPSFELLGEVLLAAGRAEEAVAAFRRSLELAPKRWLSLRGLAQAAEKAGDRDTAERARADWRAIWHAADVAMTRPPAPAPNAPPSAP
jgi:tetratricopeptide (TPR) repeat protein